MNPIYVLCLLALTVHWTAQSPVQQSPVRATLAYSRATLPGIPGIPGGDRGAGASQSPFPTSYFIYVVVRKGAAISMGGVCLQGQPFAATLKKVASPVLIDHHPGVPTGKKDTLVKKTSDDVYQVELAEQQAAACTDHAREKLAHRHAVVVCLTSGASTWYGLARNIVRLHPAAAM